MSLVGIWSKVSKQFVFGIAEPNGKLARRALAKKIGYWEARRDRWVVKPISSKDHEVAKKEWVNTRGHND